MTRPATQVVAPPTPAQHCRHCGLPDASHERKRDCIAALRDQLGRQELQAESRPVRRAAKMQRVPVKQQHVGDPSRRAYLELVDRRKTTWGHVRAVLDEQYLLISALEERVRILDAERTARRNNLLAFPDEEIA